MASAHAQIEPKPAISRRIVLASSSPRRRELLGDACARSAVAFSWIDPGVDDGELNATAVGPEAHCAALAYFKASAGARHRRETAGPPARVIGADTICLHEGEIIGKPRDRREARATIERFMDDTHEVLTGVAILDGDSRDLFVDRATVRVGSIPTATLETYLASDAWRGKAGAYNLFDRLDHNWPITYKGDPTTIVGLPMRILADRLQLAQADAPSAPLCRTGGAA